MPLARTTSVFCSLYLLVSLLVSVVECRGGKGGSRGGRYRYRAGGDNSGAGLTAWEIVGISFGIVFAGALVMYSFYCACCEKSRTEEETSTTYKTETLWEEETAIPMKTAEPVAQS